MSNTLSHALDTLSRITPTPREPPCEITQQTTPSQHTLRCVTHNKLSITYHREQIAHLHCVDGEYIGTTVYFEHELPRIARIETVHE